MEMLKNGSTVEQLTEVKCLMVNLKNVFQNNKCTLVENIDVNNECRSFLFKYC